MKTVQAPTSTGLILICEKCGKTLARGSEENLSRDLQQLIKEKTKKLFGKKEMRAVLTSCMDICPKEKIAVAFIKNQGAPKFFEVEPHKLDKLSDEIISEFRGETKDLVD